MGLEFELDKGTDIVNGVVIVMGEGTPKNEEGAGFGAGRFDRACNFGVGVWLDPD